MADANSLTMDKPRPVSLLDTGVQGVIGKPLDRVDGPWISGAAAAVGNAIYNACGVRVRDFPITCDKLLAGLPAM